MTFTVRQLAGFGKYTFTPRKITRAELDDALGLVENRPSDDDVVAADKLKQAFKGLFLEAIGFRGKPSREFLLQALETPPPQDTSYWVPWSRYATLVNWLEQHRPSAEKDGGTWV